MKLSGFSYVRNGLEFDYPFIQSIQSVLPICDEFVIAVGDSTDGTREAIENLKSDKIKIIDTVWDMTMREGGRLFAQQANIALDNITGDWALHIQADELIHENDIQKVRKAIEENQNNPMIDGFILPYYHFYGSYDYIRNTRKIHRYEVRAFRNEKYVRSYRDSQGFRIYKNAEDYNFGKGSKGTKLKVKIIDAHIYHYNYVRPPKNMIKKAEFFASFWDKKDGTERREMKEDETYYYGIIDKLEKFTKTHPALMEEIIKNQNWKYEYDPKISNMSFIDKLLNGLTDLTGIRLFEYKNYKKV
ncbi:MAG: glycosyltransferase [Bacteroidetes bacterium]|nr:MAG: glycosyltransferase [Bacteroidota bacterium]